MYQVSYEYISSHKLLTLPRQRNCFQMVNVSVDVNKLIMFLLHLLLHLFEVYSTFGYKIFYKKKKTELHIVSGYTKLIQRPSLWLIDLKTDKRIRRFEIPDTIVKEGHGMVSLRVDVDKGNCDKAFAYIPDYLKQKIYVYRYNSGRYHIERNGEILFFFPFVAMRVIACGPLVTSI